MESQGNRIRAQTVVIQKSRKSFLAKENTLQGREKSMISFSVHIIMGFYLEFHQANGKCQLVRNRKTKGPKSL